METATLTATTLGKFMNPPRQVKHLRLKITAAIALGALLSITVIGIPVGLMFFAAARMEYVANKQFQVSERQAVQLAEGA